MAAHSPSLQALHEVARRLKKQGVVFALGGSGLMSYFGCDVDIRDWDITTDAPLEVVEKAIQGLKFKRVAAAGIYATQGLYKISIDETSIDLMVGFALQTNGGVYSVPTEITADWNGIPIGSAEVWIKVYEILGRQLKADMLRAAIASRKL